MAPVVAVLAPGAMGAAVGGRLNGRGVRVLSSLQGRSSATVTRASAAGMLASTDEEIAGADFLLSILPPGDAVALAQRFVPALAASNSKTVYVDCNAINPTTVERIAAVLAPAGCEFVDAGIIGPPSAPRFYASGPAAACFAVLRDYGLDVRVVDGALGAASALKMSYAGITKGTQALGAAMMIAAARAGAADALFAELQSSQKEMLGWFTRNLATMPPKAYRWIAEMNEIAGFVGDDPAAGELYEAAAHFYERIAEDFATSKKDVSVIEAFLQKQRTSGD